ncbi:MAG: adenylate/guanylate cyclase domain-containing protein [Actinomycetota bacterium]|nr:adenylate/guanylate cyclase domain-containing protein [Actinomycetota bacterium]
MNALLAQTADALEATGLAAFVCDHQWSVQWISEELKVLLNEHDETKLGIGKHLIECWVTDTWSSRVTPESRTVGAVTNIPIFLWDTPGGSSSVERWFSGYFGVEQGPMTFDVAPEQPPALWANTLDFIQGDLPPVTINQIFIKLVGPDGHFGFAVVYDQALPARLVALVARGDQGMFERMARLVSPGRRAAAILFADIESSTQLARRLPSSAYFDLIRDITTSIDQIVVDHRGIVGRHAGDGVTAFFLVSDCGSPSGAAREAIKAARDMHLATAGHTLDAAIIEGQTVGCPMRIGLHWGPNLYMGQLVTGGRLEITALGDEVNDCARIEQTSTASQTLASKILIEQLDPGDSSALGIDPDTIRYRTIGEIAGAPAKATRDAGMIPVTIV